MNIDLALLRSFLYVVESGSMTEAAARLHLTQGAVSQQIKRLEEAFGHPLLEREPRRLAPTAAGRRLVGKAAQLIALNDALVSEMTQPDVRGPLRLGLPYDLVGTHMAPVLQQFAHGYPEVEVSLVSGSSNDLRKALAGGKLDLALLEQALGARGGERLMVDRLAWVGMRAGRAFAKRPLPVCLVSDTCVFRPLVFAALQQAHIRWRQVFDNASVEATNVTVRADLAVTAWLASTVPADLELLGGEAGLPPLPEMAIHLHLAKGRPTPAMVAMAGAIRSAYRERQR